MSNVLKFSSEKVVKPKKIRFSQSRNSPVLEATNSENLIIQKFLKFLKRDTNFQLELFKKAGLSKEQLDRNLFASSFLLEYIDLLLLELEKGLEKN